MRGRWRDPDHILPVLASQRGKQPQKHDQKRGEFHDAKRLAASAERGKRIFSKSDNQSAPFGAFSSHTHGLESNRRIILGQNVIRLRGVRGLTQERLAELVDVDRRYIQRIEAGTANPGIDVLARLKLALAVSWTRLLD